MFPVVPLNYETLAANSRPVDPTAPESYVTTLFDTQTYPTTGITQLTFFKTVQSDQSLGNMPQAGTLPDRNYFIPYAGFIDYETVPSVLAGHAVTGAVNDLQLIQNSARGWITFFVNNKPYGQAPIRMYGASGGARAALVGTYTAEVSIQVANALMNGGFPFNGSLIIPPNIQFSAQIAFQGTLVPIAAATNIAVTLLGVWYRPLS